MIQLKPTPLYAVQVPEEATEFITGIGKEGKAALCYYVEFANNREFRCESIDFIVEPIGTYQSGKIDFDAMLLFNEKPLDSFGNTLYKDYVKDKYEHWNALDSFESLLEANKVPIRDN